MRHFLIIAACVALTACGSRETVVERPDESAQVEREPSGLRGLFGGRDQGDRVQQNVVYGQLAPEVLTLNADRTLDGVIIAATTRVGATSAFDVSLRELNNGLPDADGFISFEFRFDTTTALPPPGRDRVLTAAEFVSAADLDDARGIRVISASNSRSFNR
ncbi:MAG: hypothetical protein AAF826_04700 [Pseudomonadota bacterium]